MQFKLIGYSKAPIGGNVWVFIIVLSLNVNPVMCVNWQPIQGVPFHYKSH